MFKGNFINNKFVPIKNSVQDFILKSPANLKDIISEISFNYSSIDEAVGAAKTAFKTWKKLKLEERKNYILKIKKSLELRIDEFSKIISREVGKPLWESKNEIQSMINKIDISLNEGLKQVNEYEIENILPNVKGVCRYKPYGVFVVLGPFNFPGHLPHGHIIPALLAGNTIVFKPSEKTPLTGQFYAEILLSAELPSGVFNLVHGDGEVGRRLITHKDISGVLFTGSYDVGLKIKKETIYDYWKILVLEMGGKNPCIVHEDANLEGAILETLVSAYITSGQRCSATSKIFVHKKILDSFLLKFHERAKKIKIGHPFEEVFMGPLIDKSAVEKYHRFQGIALREGFEVVMRGKELSLKDEGYYVSPSIFLLSEKDITKVKKGVYWNEEIFGPNVSVIPYEEIEEAVELANSTEYGLVCSVFTSNMKVYEKFLEDLEFGLINLNRGTVGASSKLPFGGIKKSGNFRPTAISAALYCSYPVSSLEADEVKVNNYIGI
jgi:succinylglutamic semialdehyde dehydrogenase